MKTKRKIMKKTDNTTEFKPIELRDEPEITVEKPMMIREKPMPSPLGRTSKGKPDYDHAWNYMRQALVQGIYERQSNLRDGKK